MAFHDAPLFPLDRLGRLGRLTADTFVLVVVLQVNQLGQRLAGTRIPPPTGRRWRSIRTVGRISERAEIKALAAVGDERANSPRDFAAPSRNPD